MSRYAQYDRVFSKLGHKCPNCNHDMKFHRGRCAIKNCVCNTRNLPKHYLQRITQWSKPINIEGIRL